MKDFILSHHALLINSICCMESSDCSHIDNLYNNKKESHFEANFISFLVPRMEESLMLSTVSPVICFCIFSHFIAKRLYHLQNLNFSLFFKLEIWVL